MTDIVCSAGCKRSGVLAADGTPPAGWEQLPITGRWCCSQCWRDLTAANHLPGPPTTRFNRCAEEAARTATTQRGREAVNFHQHKTNNAWLGRPAGVPTTECEGLPITRVAFDNVTVCFSYWRPSAEDLAALNAGKSIRLGVWGATQPPVHVGVEGDGAVREITDL